MMITQLKDINPAKIKSISMDWFVADNELSIPNVPVTYEHYDIPLDRVTVNKELNILGFYLGNEKTIIRQTAKGLKIKSDQYEKPAEDFPIAMYASDKGLIFIRADKEDYQVIYVNFK